MKERNPVESTVKFYNGNSDSYFDETSDISKFPAVKNALDKLLAYTRRDALIGDIGCGSGRDAEYLRKNSRTLVCFDISRNLLTRANRSFSFLDLNAADMRALPLKDESLDAVVSCASLVHIPKAEAAPVLRTLNSVLRHGGVLYLSVKEGDGEAFDERNRYFSYYEENEIIEALKAANFKIFETYRTTDSRGTKWLNVFCGALK